MYTLRAIDPNGNDHILPDCDKVQVNVAMSDVGSISFDYSVNGVFTDLVKDQLEVAVIGPDGVEVPDTRAILEGGNGQRLAPENVLYRSWAGRTLWKAFEEALVYNAGWPTPPIVDEEGNTGVPFASATVGTILGTLFQKAQSLGELEGITWDFNGAADSGGNLWSYNWTIIYDVGVNLLQVIQNMTDSGMAEFRMVGRTMQVFNPGMLGMDKSSSIVLWAGQNTLEAPEQTNSAGLRTVAVVKGDNGAWTEVVDPTGVARYGRRAMLVSVSGVEDIGTLSVIGQSNIDQVNRIRSELTYKYVAGGDHNQALEGEYGVDPFGDAPYGGANLVAAPVPMQDYIPGDWVSTDMTGVMQSVRVRQAMIEWGAGDDPVTYTVVLNDRFMERDIALARKVEGITGGASTNGGGMPSEPPTVDMVAPAVPQGLAASSDAFVDDQGHTFAQVTASWLQVTTNADGTICEDLDHYSLWWWYDNPGFTQKRYLTALDSPISWSPVVPGQIIHIAISAVDKSGNQSPMSPAISILTGSDVTPPPVPSTPILSTPFAGMVRIEWDGLGAAGEALPPDFKWVEVHWSAVNDFVPDDTTLKDTLSGGMLSNATGVPYDQPLYVKFVGVDFTGNKSAPSAQASATPVKVGVDDVGFTAVDIGGGSFHTYIGATDPSTDPDTQLQDGEIWIDTANNNEPKRWDSTNSVWVSVRDQVEIDQGRIAAGAVTAAALAAGAISAGSLAVATAAISSAQIASLDVGKITAGTLFADITVSSRIKTSDTGARVELNNQGLLAYNSGGSLTARISSADGSALITGTYRTALSGQRVEINPAGGVGGSHSITFYNISGQAQGLFSDGSSIYMRGVAAGSQYAQIGLDNAGQASLTSKTSSGFSSGYVTVDGNGTQVRGSGSLWMTSGGWVQMTASSTMTISGSSISLSGSTTVSGSLTTNGATIATGYKLNTDRIEATNTGLVRIEPSINVVSLVTYNNTYTASANMYVTSSGSYGRATSSAKYKVNIDRDWGDRAPLQAVKQLKPTSYWDKGDAERLAHHLDLLLINAPLKEAEDEYEGPRQLIGLIAEDVDSLGLNDLVVYDEAGNPDGVMYDRLPVMLLPWLHELEDRLKKLEKRTNPLNPRR